LIIIKRAPGTKLLRRKYSALRAFGIDFRRGTPAADKAKGDARTQNQAISLQTITRL
jgi:hypothetical protein